MALRHCFIVPDLHGPISGGTLYNRRLIAALGAAGIECAALDLGQGRDALHADPSAVFWLDSLFLSALPELERAAPGRVGLVLHYLPSLLRHGDELSARELAADEAFALERTRRFLLPSAFMQQTLERLGASGRLFVVVEPGRPAAPVLIRPRGGGVRALVVANLTPNKGVEPLLAALAGELGESDRFELDVIGSCSADPAYARSCERWLGSGRVRLLGALAPQEVTLRMAESNLLISASHMESYGMALAEARALGLPIVALRGGNTAVHVMAGAGGELVGSHAALARACVRLCRDGAEHERRLALAHAGRLAERSWSDAAREFVLQLSTAAAGVA